MRDGTMGGNGFGAASNPGGTDWDQGLFRDDAHSHAPGTYAPQTYPPQAHPPHEIPGQRPGPGDDAERSPTPAPGGHRRGGARKKPRSRKRRVVKWVAIITAAGVLGTAGAAYGYYEYLASKIRKGQRQSGTSNVAKPKPNANGDTPMNILILGSDSRNSADDVKLGGARSTVGEPPRADVIMIAHLSADRSNMSVVSIPRDTRVNIPPCTDPKTKKAYPAVNSIINESLGRGGAGCTLATVQNLTGVYIDHWLTIDFSGVVKMADVVGGVEVCVRYPVSDHPTKDQPGGSHLLLKHAGKQTIYGETALQWLRTRHAFYDDAGRAKAQHMYMSSLIRKLRSQNLFTNPAKLNKIATTAMSAFEVSSEIGTPKKLYDLGMELKTVPSNRITMLTMPHIEDNQNKAHYLPAPDADTVWSLLRNDVAMDANGKAKTTGTPSPRPTTPAGPPAAAPGTIPVTVVNGTAGTSDGIPTGHRASSIAQTLQTAGFTQATASRQASPSPGTTLVYPASAGAQGKSDALAVAKALKIPAGNVKASTAVQTITLTIGADWKAGTDFSKTLPTAGGVPKSADIVNGADEGGCMDVYKPYRYYGP